MLTEVEQLTMYDMHTSFTFGVLLIKMFSAYDARQPQITFDHTHTQEQQGSCTNEG